MREYVFRYASGYGCDMSALMDGGRVTVGDYFASESTDHYGTLHEEIVRCRDCKFSRIHDGKRYPGKKAKGRMYCINWCDGYEADWTKPDGFCHRAKRKEGGA